MSCKKFMCYASVAMNDVSFGKICVDFAKMKKIYRCLNIN